MKRFFSILLFVLLVSAIVTSCFADASDIQMGMTKEEVIAIMGEPGIEGKAYNDMDDLITYNDVMIGDYKFKFECVFRDGVLISKNYSANETEFVPSIYNKLRKALEDKYGKYDVDKALLGEALRAVGTNMTSFEVDLLILSGLSFRTWKPSEDTCICLTYMSNKQYTCLIYFMPNQINPEKKTDSNSL